MIGSGKSKRGKMRMIDSGLLHCGWSVVRSRGDQITGGPLHALWGAWHCIMSAENQGTQEGFQLVLFIPPVSQKYTVARFSVSGLCTAKRPGNKWTVVSRASNQPFPPQILTIPLGP